MTGAAELNMSKNVTGFLTQGGNDSGAALAIFTAERPSILYGSSASDFKLVASNFEIGYAAYTMQQVSNDAFGLTSRGIQALMATQAYGDFEYASVSHMVQPFMTTRKGLETASTTLRAKNQYRLYFSDNTALAVGLDGAMRVGRAGGPKGSRGWNYSVVSGCMGAVLAIARLRRWDFFERGKIQEGIFNRTFFVESTLFGQVSEGVFTRLGDRLATERDRTGIRFYDV